MPKRKDPKITISMESKDERLTLKAFLKVIGETLDILNGVEKEMSKEDNSLVDWEIVNIQKQSPLSMTIVGQPREGYKVPPQKILKCTYSGLRIINRIARKPKFFNENLLAKAKNLSSPLEDGVDFIEFNMEKEKSLRLTPKIINNVERLSCKKSPYYHIDTCLEGILEIMDVHGRKPEFFIFDPLTNDKIRCFFESNLVQEIASSITRRLRVYGEAKYNRKNHKPLSVNVSQYEVIKKKEDLPKINDLHKANIDITEGQASEDFIEELRDAE